MHSLRFDGWKLNIHFSAAHCIPFHEKCERLHGHHYAVHCEIDGALDAHGTGWVMDFGPVKRAMKDIADELDHRVLVPTAPGKVSHTIEEGQLTMVVVDKRYVFPVEDCALVPVPTSTAEHLASHFLQRMLDTVSWPDNISELKIGVDEGHGQGAWVSHRFHA